MRLAISGKSFVACDGLQHAFDLQALGAIDVELLAIATRSDDGTDTWQPSLRRKASVLDLKCLSTVDEAQLRQGDVLISLEYDRIITPRQLTDIRAYNIHFSQLPRYRGCLTSLWPLRESQATSAVTLHEITPGIDDGPIIDQMEFPLTTFMTSQDLYLQYNRHAFELFKCWLPRLLEGDAPATSQAEAEATYYARDSVDFAEVTVSDFEQSAVAVRDYTRSLIFLVYQTPIYGGKPVFRCDVVSVPGRLDPVGTCPISDESHSVVACADGYVRFWHRAF